MSQEKINRRTGTSDRRSSRIDRRQFIDIGWPIGKERRLGPRDRRLGPADRRIKTG